MSSEPALDPRPLGELLQTRGLVGAADVERALELQPRVGGRLGSLLMRVGAVSEDTLLDTLGAQLGWPLLGRDEPLPAVEALRDAAARLGVSVDWLLDQQCLLWPGEDGQWCCAARDALQPALRELLRIALKGHPPHWTLIRNHDLERTLEALAQMQPAAREARDDVQHLRELAEEAPVVELVNNLLSQAVEQRASDLHFEPEERSFSVRFRVDGVLYARLTLPRERYDAVSSRLKLISGMDIAERRLPQDGRLSARVSGQEMDVRVSSLPGVHGESIVMRLLPKERTDLRLDNLGMLPDHLELTRAWMREAHGIVLVTGPTGSGKSTTLYSALAAADDGQRKIITVEDPVEFQLPGITQIQTHAAIGLTFAHALRSILRQDPDVVMIGEIRDLETAEIAIQAALTGHLVLSTLHTNDSISAFTRLIDMGVEPFLVATPIKAVQAQRLVRRLCPHCARPGAAPAGLDAGFDALVQRVLGDAAPAWRQPEGCPRCMGTGYLGRIGIYELVPISATLRAMITARASTAEMTAQARSEGWRMLREDGFLKARQGITTVEEVLRVTSI